MKRRTCLIVGAALVGVVSVLGVYFASGAAREASNAGDAKTTTYHYDALGNLRTVSLPDGTKIEYLIDPANRRIGKKVNGTLVQGFLYQDTLKPVAELDGQNKIVSRFIYGDQANVPEAMDRGGKVYRIITDDLGSPRLVVDAASGKVAQRIDYDEFGKVLKDTNPGFQPFGYSGGLYDPQTQFVRLGARDYDSAIGRWLTRDPIRFAGQQANLHAYVGNDPINRHDPTGLHPPIVKRNPDGSTDVTFVCPVNVSGRPWPPVDDIDRSTITASEGDTALAIRDGSGGGGGETVRPPITIKQTHNHHHGESIFLPATPPPAEAGVCAIILDERQMGCGPVSGPLLYPSKN